MKYEFMSIRVPAELKDEIRELSIEQMESITQTAIHLMQLGLTTFKSTQQEADNDDA